MKKCFSVGNIVLSDIYQQNKPVRTNLPGGINYRFLLSQILAGLSCDYVSCSDNSTSLEKISKAFLQNNCNSLAEKFVKNQKIVKFKWFFSELELEKLEFINLQNMEDLVGLINRNFLQNYDHINICALGLENEKKILSMIDENQQTTSYIFHESNLNSAKSEDYLDFFTKINYVFLNDEEALKLTGAKNLRAALKILLRLNQITFVTSGAKGAYCLNKGQLLYAQVPQIPVINTAGAGDIFAGAVIAALRMNNSLDFSLRYGLYLAALSTTGYLTEALDTILFHRKKEPS